MSADIAAVGGFEEADFRDNLAVSREDLVSERVSKVYGYSAGAMASSCATAVVCASTGIAAKVTALFAANPVLSLLGLTAVGIALLAATYFTPKEQTVQKHALFGAFTVMQGVILSPLVVLGGTTIFAAASATTAAVVGGLGVLAMRLKQSFERYETILMIGLGAIAAASLGALFLPTTAAAIAHKISLIGGLALFSALVVHDVHKARSAAAGKNFDEINHSIDVYLDAMNLLIRIWEIYIKMKNR